MVRKNEASSFFFHGSVFLYFWKDKGKKTDHINQRASKHKKK